MSVTLEKPRLQLNERTKRMVLQDYLNNRGEVDLMNEVLAPLLENMGYEHVHLNHGSNELGKDFLVVERDKLGNPRVTAIVVKNADIKNTASAKATVSEVLRQVNQSWRNQVELISYPKMLPSEVWVLTSGHFSITAKEEILNSVQDFNRANTKFVDQDQLLGLVDQHYPQLFFFRMPTVAQYFCDLAEHLKSATTIESAESSFFGRMEVLCFKNSKAPSDQMVRSDFRRTTETVASGKITWLQGGTGSGKTFTLYRTIQNSLDILRKPAHEGAEIDILIPVYLKAADLGQSGSPFDLAKLTALICKYSSVSETEVQKWIDHGRVLFVVDEFERNQRVEPVDDIFQSFIASSAGRHGLLILSRQMDEYSFKFSFKPDVWHLSDLNLAQAVKIIDQAIPVEDVKSRSAFRELQQNGVLERMPRTPLALNVLSYVFSAGVANTPNNTCEFFDMFFSLVLGRWERQRDTGKTFDYQQVRAFLQGAALLMTQRNLTEVAVSDLEALAARILQGVNEKNITPSEFIKKVGLIGDVVTIENNILSFTHRTYLEFLAGCEYAQFHWKIDDVLSRSVDLQWEDCIIFAAGFRRRDEELLNQVDKIPETDTRQQFLKVKNIALLTQALYQSEIAAKTNALIAGAKAAKSLRDNTRMEEGLKKIFVGISELGVSLINLKLFSLFYARRSLGSANLAALNAVGDDRARYYLMCALCGADLDSADLAEFKKQIDPFSFELGDKEAVALPWFIEGEHKELNTAALSAMLESSKYKKMAKKAVEYLTPKRPQ